MYSATTHALDEGSCVPAYTVQAASRLERASTNSEQVVGCGLETCGGLHTPATPVALGSLPVKACDPPLLNSSPTRPLPRIVSPLLSVETPPKW